MLTIKAASEKYPLSKSLLYELCRQNRLRHYRVGTRGRGKLLVDENDLTAFIASCRVEESPDEDGELKYLR